MRRLIVCERIMRNRRVRIRTSSAEQMKVTHIPLDTARKLAVRGQLFDSQAKRVKDKRGVAHIVAQLGYIQIDTIAVIQRTHHHTLWTRQPDYHPDMLHSAAPTLCHDLDHSLQNC